MAQRAQQRQVRRRQWRRAATAGGRRSPTQRLLRIACLACGTVICPPLACTRSAGRWLPTSSAGRHWAPGAGVTGCPPGTAALLPGTFDIAAAMALPQEEKTGATPPWLPKVWKSLARRLCETSRTVVQCDRRATMEGDPRQLLGKMSIHATLPALCRRCRRCNGRCCFMVHCGYRGWICNYT